MDKFIIKLLENESIKNNKLLKNVEIKKQIGRGQT